MKFSLCLALLVLVASATVHGQGEDGNKPSKGKTVQKTEVTIDQDPTKNGTTKTTVETPDSESTNTRGNVVQKIDVTVNQTTPESTTRRDEVVEKTEPETTNRRGKVVSKTEVTVTQTEAETTTRRGKVVEKTEEEEETTTRRSRTTTTTEAPTGRGKVVSKTEVTVTQTQPESTTRRGKVVEKTEEEEETTTRRSRPTTTTTESTTRRGKVVSKTDAVESESEERETTTRRGRTTTTPVPTPVKPSLRPSFPPRDRSDNEVHIRGSIVLTSYRPLAVDAVGYEVKTGRYNNGKISSSFKPRLTSSEDILESKSRVTLYVSTMKKVDPKLAFANFSIAFTSDHFPIPFDINVPLPQEQLDLYREADLTLYFFVYVSNVETRQNTYLPDGISQILLQGTNQVVQQLQINVKANGIELKGFFHSRYSDGYIRPGTAFQVAIVTEQSLSRLIGESSETVAQVVINQVPAMYPMPFSLLVSYQQLKLKTKYYAIAYIFENGVERLIHQQPILVINDDLSLVTPEIIFTVVPHPFILYGTVTRSMPGSFYFEQGSSIIISVHEKDSDSPAFTFRLPVINQLPQDIEVNITQASQFDATKDYEVLAMVMDSKHQIYMSSSKKIPIRDRVSRLTLPVDDLYYYVELSLHSSANQPLTYIPGSRATVIVAENAEVTSTPIYSAEFDPTEEDFRQFLMRIPIARAQRYSNAYLILLINNTGILTHVSRLLLISNYQRPPLHLQLPVIALNVLRGQIFDEENRPAQWSSASYANLYLLDDGIDNPSQAIVQVWKIHLEREFPVNYEVPLDFSVLRTGHSYRLQASIEYGPNLLEYRPANSLLVIKPEHRIQDNLRLLVRNVKKTQLVKGLIYMTDVVEPLPARGQVIIQMSSSSVYSTSEVVHEIRLDVEGETLPLNFTLELPLDRVDINGVYYLFVRYAVGNTVVVPSIQAFAFSPRNDATVIIKLSRSPQVRITGQVASTGGRLILPEGTTLHLYITDNAVGDKPTIYSEVSLRAATNSYYQFTMFLDSIILQQNVTLYLRADIIHKRSVILSMPRAALLQITPSGEWNINLVVDLPTILVGQINLIGQQELFNGNFEAYIQIVQKGTQNVVSTSRLRLTGSLPLSYRIEIENSLIVEYGELEAIAIIKNCREETIFKSGGSVGVHARINVDVNLPVILTDPEKLKEATAGAQSVAPIAAGEWQLSATNVDIGVNYALVAVLNEKETRRRL